MSRPSISKADGEKLFSMMEKVFKREQRKNIDRGLLDSFHVKCEGRGAVFYLPFDSDAEWLIQLLDNGIEPAKWRVSSPYYTDGGI